MLKYHADFAEVALAVSPRDENLYADGKAHRQSGEDEIIQARHHGSTQLDGAEVTQEGRVGEGDDGLRQVTQHDGVSDAPDLFVGDGGFYHVTKLGISFRHKTILFIFPYIFPSLFPKNVFLHLL